MSADIVSIATARKQETRARRFRFSKQSLSRAVEQFANDGNITLRDEDLRGFVCRKQTKAWMLGVERKVRGKLYRVPIREFTAATKPGEISTTRDRASAIMADLAAGTYMPEADRRALDAKARHLHDLTIHSAPDFHAEENPHVRASTIDNYRFAVKRMFKDDVRMENIDAGMVRDEYRRMLDTMSDASAANALRSVRALWQTWADAHPDDAKLPSNPVKKLTGKRKAVKRVPVREGALTPAQRPLWWAEAQHLAMVHGTTYRALQMLFLTGCRLSEVLGLRWDEVGEDSIEIGADRMKAGVELKRPTTDGMRRILDAQRGLSDVWVFPSKYADGPVSDPRKSMTRIGFGITPHDLRRTYISTAKTTGIPDVALKMLVGHSINDITDSYAVPLREQLPEFAAQIEAALLS